MSVPPSTVLIRPAAPADAAALGRLGAQLVATHHAFDPLRFLAPTPSTERGYAGFLTGELSRPEVILLVAEAGGEVVGYAYGALEGTDYMTLRGPAGVLQDILVDPARRGAGTGRRLLDAMLAAFAERGVPRVVLSTADRNAAAQALFAAAGFRRTMVEMTWEAPPPTK